jgi:tetratricopeptide (TPR) repeat protein
MACKTTEIQQGRFHPAAIQETQYGMENMRQGRFAAAEEHLSKSIGIDPRYALAYERLGVIMMKRGLHQTAEKHFRDAVKNDPSFTQGWTHLGFSLLAQKRYKEAAGSFQRALDTRNDDFPARLALAQTYRRLAKYNDARIQCLRLIAEHPQRVEPHAEMGLLLVEEEKDSEALESFERALQRDPRHLEAHRQRARLLAKRKEYKKALFHIQAMLQIQPNDPEARSMLGSVTQSLRAEGATAPKTP